MSKKPRTKWTYFFYNKQLHKKLKLHHGSDEVIAWNFETHKKMIYSWSAVQKYGERAVTLQEASKILDRSPITMYYWIRKGIIESKHRSYKLDDERRLPWIHFFSQEDLLEIRQMMNQTHRGTPRKDKKVTPSRVPSERDVRLAAQHRIFLYAKSPDGQDFIPVWEAEEWE